MNFLAHLHCSPNHDLIRVFNFTGDGFRGNSWKTDAVPEKIIGVELHRFIDTYTDQHPLSKTAKASLRNRAGKTASIALDLLGDHFLHKHWEQMSKLHTWTSSFSIHQFIALSYSQISSHDYLLEGKAARMWPFMISENWLSDYQNLSGIKRAARGMRSRHPAVSQLHDFFSELNEGDSYYNAAERWFCSFYPALLTASKQFVDDHPLSKDILR